MRAGACAGQWLPAFIVSVVACIYRGPVCAGGLRLSLGGVLSACTHSLSISHGGTNALFRS